MASNNSSTSTHETILVSNTTSLLHVNMMNVTKLDSLNYLMWSRQVHANLLDGYNLAGHLDGSTVVPSPMINTDDGSVPNPSYTLWKRQDRLIYSALLGAITTSLQPLTSTANTAAEIWTTLNMTYAKLSRAHINNSVNISRTGQRVTSPSMCIFMVLLLVSIS